MQASSVKEAISARPGLVIIKFWQGAVEIGLRTAAIVSWLADAHACMYVITCTIVIMKGLNLRIKNTSL